jgi:NAD(P)-dependent dehydrogenase (short-subunit alcohol dehydrogenase family)
VPGYSASKGAGPVLFLASASARFVTGVVLPVDGGYLIT